VGFGFAADIDVLDVPAHPRDADIPAGMVFELVSGHRRSLQLTLLSLATHLESGLSLCRGSVLYNTER